MDGLGLLDKLPPFQGNEIVLVDQQGQDDIIKQVLRRHELFASHYDHIAEDFIEGDEYRTARRLWDYCKRSIRYEVESAKKQTVRSPAAILALSDYWGADCKHYASFIGGVLDAIGRMTGEPIDWVYRFGAYDVLKPDDFGHVFVVINPQPEYVPSYQGGTEDEIWIDPVLDDFDTRSPYPWNWKDKKTRSMALVQVSGVKPITSAVIAPRDENGACVRTTPCTMGDPATVTNGLDAVEPGLGSAVNQAVSTLPDGSIKDFLQGLISNPQKALHDLLFGRTYTMGDYGLGEYLMRNILGMSNVQSRQQVPDGYVPQAWAFFTAAYGVRMRTSDDLGTLYNSAPTPQQRAQNYLNRDRNETQDISLEAATRAATVMGDPSQGGLFNIPAARDQKWSMYIFKARDYIYPIPGVLPNGPLFSGVHPVTGETFVDGYPVNYTGPRYVSQVSKVLQTGSTAAPAPAPPSGATPGTSSPGGTKTKLSDLASANPWTTALLIGGGIYALASIGTGKQSVSGIKPSTVLLLGALGLGAYLLTRKNDSGDDAPTPPPATVTPGTIPAAPAGADVKLPQGTIAPVPLLTIAPATAPDETADYVFPAYVDFSTGAGGGGGPLPGGTSLLNINKRQQQQLLYE